MLIVFTACLQTFALDDENGYSGGGGGRGCYNCGSEDHQKRDCPEGGQGESEIGCWKKDDDIET